MRTGAILRQFFTYVLSNGLAIALSFSVRLFLPSRFGFFARHRLAAAVVGIVAATGISFSMALVRIRAAAEPGRGLGRWMSRRSFSRRPRRDRQVPAGSTIFHGC